MQITNEMREAVKNAEIKLQIIEDIVNSRGYENTILAHKNVVDYKDISKVDENLGLLLESEALKAQAEEAGKLEPTDIEKVLFKEPYTIVYWADGTKTKVKCSDADKYSKDAGLAFCIAKKICGSKRKFDALFEAITGEPKGTLVQPTEKFYCSNGTCTVAEEK